MLKRKPAKKARTNLVEKITKEGMYGSVSDAGAARGVTRQPYLEKASILGTLPDFFISSTPRRILVRLDIKADHSSELELQLTAHSLHDC